MTLKQLKTEALKNIDNEWYTPLNVYQNILDLFKIKSFDYDPATTKFIAEKVKIPFYDDIETNGLKQDWRSYKNIWINPPFSLKKNFIEKAQLEISDPKSLIENIFIVLPIEALTNINTYDILSNDKVFRNLIIPKGRIKFNKLLDNGEFAQKKAPFFSSIIIHFSKNENYKLKWVDINKD